MKKRTLAFKLIAGGIIAVLIPLLAVGIFSSMKASSALETAAKDRSVKGAGKLADMVQEVLTVETKVVSEIALSSDAVNAAGGSGAEVMSKKLADAMGKIGKDYETMTVTDANGIVVADGTNGEYKGMSFADRDYFQKAKAGKVNVGTAVKSKRTGNPVVSIAAPIIKDGAFAGIATIVLKIDYLSEKVTAKMGKTGYGFMIDQTGLIVAHPEKSNILSLNISTAAGMEEIAKAMTAKQTGVQDYTFKGIKKIAGFAPIEINGWSVCLTQDRNEFLEAANSIRNFIFVAVIIFLALTIVAVSFFARSISAPIKNAVDQMEEAANLVGFLFQPGLFRQPVSGRRIVRTGLVS